MTSAPRHLLAAVWLLSAWPALAVDRAAPGPRRAGAPTPVASSIHRIAPILSQAPLSAATPGPLTAPQAATLAAVPGLAAGSRGPALSATNTAAPWTTDANSDRAGPAPNAATPLGRHIWSEAERLDFAVHGSPDDDLAWPETSRSPTPLAVHAAARNAPVSPATPPKPAPAELENSQTNTARRSFFVSLLIAQMGVEIIGLAVPQLANQLASNLATAALLPAVSFTALAAGSLVAGPAVDWIGIRKVYIGALLARAAAGSALAAAYVASALAFPGLVALFGIDYIFLGASRVAEAIAPTELYGSAQGQVQGFGTVQARVIEGMGILGILAGGALLLLAWEGFGAALVAYPLLALSSAMVAWRHLRFAKRAVVKRRPWRQQMSEAFAALRASPTLMRAAAAYGLSVMLTGWVYFTITPTLGLLASNGGVPVALGTMLGGLFYAIGGFSATILIGREDARRGPDPSPEQGRRRLIESTSRWLMASAAALLGALSLSLAATPQGLAVALAFLLLFGMTASGMNVHLEALIKTEAPETLRGSIMGTTRAASLLAAAASFPALGCLFNFFSVAPLSGSTPMPTAYGFWTLAIVLGGTAAFFARVAAALRRA